MEFHGVATNHSTPLHTIGVGPLLHSSPSHGVE
jgi:hypothetical protein